MQLFRRLFRGRTDVYPLRWESRNSGKSGYAPACANEWRTGICDKPRICCADLWASRAVATGGSGHLRASGRRSYGGPLPTDAGRHLLPARRRFRRRRLA
ncbi:TOTE conflict system archaeo-eukaryotic primase domain-containing protein [Burkholderia sp. MSHR3999]|uniref:TOTE conflict system archaeo-eukaryotic primase domain-containing protein n=1 Tax=Burkholderia sp. MSHR3999 TaxID=1542965 RepID=UPI003FA47D43